MIAWLKDIRFWIGITFIHRLFSIMQPPLEAAHNWRQTTVAMVARNFLELDPNIFYPRVDMAGALSGITGMEFPLLNYLIYLVSLVFGYDHWYGRLINLVVSSAGIYAFYSYLKNQIGRVTAFNAAFILLFSLFYYYSRKIMPDTFSISLVFMGLWAWDHWQRRAALGYYLLGLALITLGVLSKLPTVVTLAFAVPLFLAAHKRQRILIVLGFGLSGFLSAWWYFYWVPHLEFIYGYKHFFMGKGALWTFRYLIHNGNDILYMFYERTLGYTGFVACVGGLFFVKRSSGYMRLITLATTLLFCGLLIKSGDKFSNHEYYVLPIAPIMALWAGFLITQVDRKWILILLLTSIAVEGVVRKWEDQFIKSSHFLVDLDKELDAYMDEEALIVINSGEFPTPMYFAHRKGWVTTNEKLANSDYLEELVDQGCEFALILKSRFGSPMEMNKPVVLDNEDFTLYEL